MTTHDTGEDMALIPMRFQDYHIQIIVENGVTWWSARGIMYVLGMNKQGTSQLMARLDEDEKRLFTIYTNRGARETWFINEHGLYDLLMKSRKPESKRFQRWVKHEVLPQIRRTGRYMPTGERFFANTERQTQLLNSKAVVPVLTRFGGRNDLITWYRDSLYGVSGATPKEWRATGRAQGLPAIVCQSGREVTRHLQPAAACATSLADDLVIHDIDAGEAMAIALDSVAIFQRILDAKPTPQEMSETTLEGDEAE